ncbi:hypothetical protein SynBIOSE41_02406 [Synechococcus sp. BIOS-E4-1]|nr:hypothetical protein SynBIOSE41_02406 [Synechococcus sp. BIOS-E4-1]
MNCFGELPLDSFMITSLLVKPTVQLWFRTQEVVVSFW